MNLIELPSDMLSKIFDYNLDYLEASIEKLEKKNEIIQLTNEIMKRRIITIFENIEPIIILYEYYHIYNNIETKIMINTDLFNIIDTYYKIRLIIDIGKTEYIDDGNMGMIYQNKYENNIYVSPVLYLARYLDAFILAIKIHQNAYKDNNDITALLEVYDVICIDDLNFEYEYDELNTEPDIKYYAIVY